MRRSRITITLSQQTLTRVDQIIDKKKIRNRSHAIEFLLNQSLQSRVTKAVILAGGKGENLRPYTYEVPKPLLPVKGKPILEYLISQLKVTGITDIYICIGYLGEKIVDYFGDGSQFGVRLTYIREKEPLNTGGALLNTKKYLQAHPFLLIYGDILTNIPFIDLIEFHLKEQPLVTVALTTVHHPSQYGQLKAHGTKLVKFFQKDIRAEIKSHLVNCGIYMVNPGIFEVLPKTKKNFSFEDILSSLIDQKQVNGFIFEDQWFDVGNPDSYEQAIKEFVVTKTLQTRKERQSPG